MPGLEPAARCSVFKHTNRHADLAAGSNSAPWQDSRATGVVSAERKIAHGLFQFIVFVVNHVVAGALPGWQGSNHSQH